MLNGWGVLQKKRKVLLHLEGNKINITYLQETHLISSSHDHLNSRWFGKVYYSSFTSNSRGVAILICKNIPFSLEEVKSDPMW